MTITNPGVCEWFSLGEQERAEQVIDDLKRLGVSRLRTNISWTDGRRPEGEAWYRWLLPRLTQDFEVVPYLTPTLPGYASGAAAEPRNAQWLTDLLDDAVAYSGDRFEFVEFWNDPSISGEGGLHAEAVSQAVRRARERGKRVVLGGVRPGGEHGIRHIAAAAVMEHIAVIGVQWFPGTFDEAGGGWSESIAAVREALAARGADPAVWITETGYSTWRHDEKRQLGAFLAALDAPVERLYWYGPRDSDPFSSPGDGRAEDPRTHHFGLRNADGTPKLLMRLWEHGGVGAVREAAWLSRSPRLPRREERSALITGGAGFVGTNLANRLLEHGRRVILYDNLSRPGVEENLRWLRATHGERVQIEVGDLRDGRALRAVVERADEVYHFAAQVAVTTSLDAPVHDFEVNARGALNLLEALRSARREDPPPLVFTSTNKVYGNLDDIALRVSGCRYEPADARLRRCGIGEDRPLDFHSPYGCSKGTADQYILDYARTFDLPAVVFRMSCIYGPHQFGNEDQGWVAHFLIRALEGKPITLYGDGMQVRDTLFVEDLVDAFLSARDNIRSGAGQAFNIGGGPANTTSLLELIDRIEDLRGTRPVVRFDAWRPGDQRYYVSDTRRFEKATGWSPRVGVREGVRRLYEWLCAHRGVSAALPEEAVVRGKL